MMRIISGKARGIKLATLEGEATRPTSERAKEAVFSMIQFDLEGREVLDLFGGSGQLALEALSRGAANAAVCDRSRAAVAIINTDITQSNTAIKVENTVPIASSSFAQPSTPSASATAFPIKIHSDHPNPCTTVGKNVTAIAMITKIPSPDLSSVMLP